MQLGHPVWCVVMAHVFIIVHVLGSYQVCKPPPKLANLDQYSTCLSFASAFWNSLLLFCPLLMTDSTARSAETRSPVSGVTPSLQSAYEWPLKGTSHSKIHVKLCLCSCLSDVRHDRVPAGEA